MCLRFKKSSIAQMLDKISKKQIYSSINPQQQYKTGKYSKPKHLLSRLTPRIDDKMKHFLKEPILSNQKKESESQLYSQTYKLRQSSSKLIKIKSKLLTPLNHSRRVTQPINSKFDIFDGNQIDSQHNFVGRKYMQQIINNRKSTQKIQNKYPSFQKIVKNKYCNNNKFSKIKQNKNTVFYKRRRKSIIKTITNIKSQVTNNFNRICKDVKQKIEGNLFEKSQQYQTEDKNEKKYKANQIDNQKIIQIPVLTKAELQLSPWQHQRDNIDLSDKNQLF